MKNFIKSAACITTAVCMLVSAFSAAGADNTANNPEYEKGTLTEFGEEISLAADNGKYRLYYKKSIGSFYIEDNGGNKWYAVPEQLNKSADYAGEAASLVKLTYYNKSSDEGVFYSYSDSVARSQTETEKITDGLRIIYSMGEDNKKSLLPAAITEKSMEDNILSKLGEGRKKRRVLSKYRLISREEVIDDGEWKDFLSAYPVLKNENIYILDDVVQREKEELSDIFKEIGYTVEQCKADEEKAGGSTGVSTQPFAKIPLEIRLTDTGFTATVRTEKIETGGDCAIGSLDILPFFDARSNGERGEILYPDGSGVVFAFGGQNGGNPASSVTKSVYGNDYSRLQKASYVPEQPIRLPVLGMTGSNKGFLSVITSGEAIASQTAAFSGSSLPYNRAYTSFAVRNAEQFTFEDWYNAGYRYNIVDKQQYSGDVSLQYFLLSGDKADLGGQAECYREYLKKSGYIKQQSKTELPFYLETSGVFRYETKVNGLNKNKKTALTEFSQAEDMLKELSTITDNMKLIYTGWANGGFEYTAYTSVKPEKILGGKKGIAALSDYTDKNGIAFYPQLETVTVVKDKWFDGFSPKKDSILRLDKKIGVYTKPLLATGAENEKASKYVLRSDIALSRSNKTLKSVNKLGLDHFALSDVGEWLSASSQSKYIDRCKTQSDVTEIIKKFSSAGGTLIRGGNAYVFPYASDILNIPTHSSGYSEYGYDVPFIAMVLNGSIDYAGEPLNLSGDYETAVLEAALNGTGAYFLLHYDNSEYLSQAGYGEYYSTDYTVWKDKAKQTYDRLNKVLGAVRGCGMEDCTLIARDIYKVDYSGGRAVLVNFSQNSYQYGDTVVPARDFILI